MKKIFLALVVFVILILAGGGFFYWWENQEDVRELNKTLPKGVRVEKILFSQEYKVVNKIDGYEFKVPREWKGLRKIEYLEEKDKGTAGISLEGLTGEMMGVGYYKLDKEDKDLDSWVEEWSERFKTFSWTLEKENINGLDIVRAKEEKHLAGVLSFFFKKGLKIYEINGFSGEFIREIIINGKW